MALTISLREIQKTGIIAVAQIALMISTSGDAVSADKVKITIGVQNYFCHKITFGNWDTVTQTMRDFASFSKFRYPHNSLSDVVISIRCSSGLNPLQYSTYKGSRGALRLMVEEYNVNVNALDWDGYTVKDYVKNQIDITKDDYLRERFQGFLSFLHHELDAKHSAKWLRENQ